jgi:hypothetical protein
LDIKIDFQHTYEGSNFGHLPEQSLWLRDPDGMLLNIVVGPEQLNLSNYPAIVCPPR